MSNEVQDATRATRVVALAFVVGVAGAIMFMVVFALGANTQLMGIGLALALGGIGYGLVAWGHRLMPPGGEVEERELMTDPAEKREAAAHEFEGRLEGVKRRRVLGGALATALGATGLAALFPLRALGPRPGDALRHTEFALVPRPRLITEDGRPVHRDDLPVGGYLVVYPEGCRGSGTAQTMLMRLDTSRVQLRAPTRQDWVMDGYIAYSRVCTHAGLLGRRVPGRVPDAAVPLPPVVVPDRGGRAADPRTGGAAAAAAAPGDRRPGLPVVLGDYPEAVGRGWWTRP